MKKLTMAILLSALTVFLVYPFVPNMYELVYRLKHGNERVYYHNRVYYAPQNKTLGELPLNGDELVPTGEKVIGLPVMDTLSSIQFQKERNVVPTLLILKQSDDRYIVYSLSGGP